MANLIITIISIALVAVVAIAGVYYGGQAYNGYMAKAKANEIINISEQLINAANAYKGVTGQYPIQGGIYVDYTVLVAEKYLSSLPAPTRYIDSYGYVIFSPSFKLFEVKLISPQLITQVDSFDDVFRICAQLNKLHGYQAGSVTEFKGVPVQASTSANFNNGHFCYYREFGGTHFDMDYQNFRP